MGDSGGKYDLTEIFVIKFVLADIVIIAALLFAGPIYAVAITALLVVSVFLVWYLMERVGTGDEGTEAQVDPITRLQARYAAGELTEREFEERLDDLIDANERAKQAGVETEELSLERAD
jgi:hypothetical protein